MSKKIIAVSLALFLIVTSFVACEKKKKYETTKINGKEVILVTDENGEPVINENNGLIAMVTDRAGEVITLPDGEPQTYNIKINDTIKIKDFAHGEHYKMMLPDGWSAGVSDRIYKDGTENRCFIQFLKVKELENNETLESYLKTMGEQGQLTDALEKEGYKVETKTSTVVISKNNISCTMSSCKITDSDGKVIHYAETGHFVVDNTIYCLNYACLNGDGYDEDFDFGSYVRNNFEYID